MTTLSQVFHTTNPTRWKRFKWTIRIFLFVALLFLGVFLLTLFNSVSPSLPKLKDKDEVYKKILNPNRVFEFNNQKLKKYKDFRQYITLKEKHPLPARRHLKAVVKSEKPDSQIRAAFYVPWDPQSFFSLRNYAGKLNMVLPEWIFLNPANDSLELRIDKRALNIMRDSGVAIVPIMSNHYNTDDFDAKAVHQLIHDPKKEDQLISQLINILAENKFQGVNVDFEEVSEKRNEALVSFQEKLYKELHKRHFTVTMDVPVFDEDYDYAGLGKWNDYLFVMAYDQHYSDINAGPISDQRWIANAVSVINKAGVPAQKIILGIAGYGYDWPDGDQASDLTYQEALTVAKENAAPIQFDPQSYNQHFSYTDDNNIAHEVYFTDATTNFNSMRFAADYGLGGVSLWRLGSEDNRLWTFYDNDMSDEGIRKNPPDLSKMTHVSLSNDVDYMGEGEILDVKTTPQVGNITLQLDSASHLITGQHYLDLPSMFVIRQFGKAGKKLVLTFDDGPDPTYTPEILDILEKEKVPAAFFLVGINAENNIPLVKRIYKDGFEIGNHTFTHRNIAKLSTRMAGFEMKATRLLIECITGHSTILFRAPYNADSQPETMQELIPVALSRKENYYTIGENIDPEDWDVAGGVNADSIFNRVVRMQSSGNIILLHDAGGNREATVKALPRIIQYFKSRGYQFTTVGDLMGKSKNQIMPVVSNEKDYYLITINYWFVTITYWLNHLLFSLFILGIILSVGRIFIIGIAAWLQHRKSKTNIKLLLKKTSQALVSIIVPAYNEEVNAVKTVRNLLKADYTNIEVIFVDDGSADATYEKVYKAFADDSRVKVFSKPNGGKASALNYGVNISMGEYLVCIDADTQLKTDAVRRLMEMFESNNTGAVAGNVKVGNEVNLLTIWQSIEYITSQNFDRRAFDLLNSITVVPGAIGAFRKSAITRAGGFTSDTLAEDCDLTIRILRSGYIIRNCPEAIAYTEAPESMKMFFRQRFRWCYGIMQSFWKHRDACFNSKFGKLGMIALPNILIFQILLPLLAPLADIIMLVGLLTGSGMQILFYYLIFLLIDTTAALIAASFEKVKLSKMLWVIPQRIVYRQLMYVILFKALRRAIKGESQHWGQLQRTGNVVEMTV